MSRGALSEEQHEHNWVEIGGCTHPHSTGTQGGTAYRCDCGKYGHRIVTFACGARRKGPIPTDFCPVLDFGAWQTWWNTEGKPTADARSARIAELRAEGKLRPRPEAAV